MIDGATCKASVISDHVHSIIHVECMKVNRIKHLSPVDRRKVTMAPLNAKVSKQNEDLANKVGSYEFAVYNDAKQGILSAHSWHSRQLGGTYSFNNTPCVYESNRMDLQ